MVPPAKPFKPPGQADRKNIHFMATSNDDLCDMPEDVRVEFGRRLNLAQRGRMPPETKSWTGLGPQVFQMSESFKGDAYRTVYYAKYEKALYVLHAFQKKASSGSETDATDIEAVKQALKGAKDHYKETYPDRKD
jgi:phage-related protein